MRFLVLGGAAMSLMASPTFSACNADLLQVEMWSITPLDGTTNEVAYTVRSNSAKAIKMVDGQLGFRDALGGTIGPMALERDAAIPASGTFSHQAKWGQFTFERLLKLQHEEVEPYTCVKAVLYDDETKEIFE